MRYFRKNPRSFWSRYDQAKFLLGNLNDSDIKSSAARAAVDADVETKLTACQVIYIGLASISCKAASLEARGFELSEDWISRLGSLLRHFEEHLLPELRGDETEQLEQFMLDCVIEAVETPENIYAYADGSI